MYFIPSDETALISLWRSSEPGPTGKSSSRESTSPRPDMDERERCGLADLWGDVGLPSGAVETQWGDWDGESTEGLKWAWAWPVNLNGELRCEGEAGERDGVVMEEDEGRPAVGGGVEQTFSLLLCGFWQTRRVSFSSETAAGLSIRLLFKTAQTEMWSWKSMNRWWQKNVILIISTRISTSLNRI